MGEGTYTYPADSTFYYATYTRLDTNKTPIYNCTNIKDAFSGSNVEAKLTYPIGLMTADEIAYAGGKSFTVLPSPYAWFYTNSLKNDITGSLFWWLISPYCWDGHDVSLVWVVLGSGYPGRLNYGGVNDEYGVRPVISIKADAQWSSGDGSPENPYKIIYN